MLRTRIAIVLAIVIDFVGAGAHAGGDVVTIEPDAYADETILTIVSPFVTLNTLDQNGVIQPLFMVTASDDASGLAPTGTRVFAHFGIPFFNTIRKLHLDFAGTTDSISLSFAGGTFLDTDTGRLEAYSESGALLATYTTQPRGPGAVEVMTLTRPSSDIAFAIAFSGAGEFGRFDALAFNTPIPEPTVSTAVLAIGGAVVARRHRRPRRD